MCSEVRRREPDRAPLDTLTVQAMLSEYAANPANAWKSKDCAIYLVLALTVKGKTGGVHHPFHGRGERREGRRLNAVCSWRPLFNVDLPPANAATHGATKTNELVNIQDFFTTQVGPSAPSFHRLSCVCSVGDHPGVLQQAHTHHSLLAHILNLIAFLHGPCAGAARAAVATHQ